MEKRVGFYDILLVSRPTNFKLSYERWREFFKKSSMAIIYDIEALGYQRDMTMLDLYKNEGITFPSQASKSEFEVEMFELTNNHRKLCELSVIDFADITVPVSQKEEDDIHKLAPDIAMQTIGHVMDLPDLKDAVPFDDRKGILFLASFGEMYYNGDAIWYFLKETYPLIVAADSQREPIPLTIAGRNIPEELREFTRNNDLDRYVTFLESPEDIKPLYDKTRVFIAPHLYGAGIQFKLSECMSMGIATVMSKLSADAFGIKPKDDIACIGDTPESFKNCVISAHNNRDSWTKLRENGLRFIKETHSREHVRELWRKTIAKGQAKRKERESFTSSSEMRLFENDLWRPNPKQLCSVGETIYKQNRADVAKAIDKGKIPSAFFHWTHYGKAEGIDYYCEDDLKFLRVGNRST